ncbi:MAG: hypothetical protein AABX71_02080 [Nanoarchaeota archaeon]
MVRKNKNGRRGAIELDTLAGWIITILALAIAIIFIFILKGKGAGALEYIKNLFRFGR